MQLRQSLLMCALVKRMILRYSASMSSDDLLARITVDPNICHGKPCIRGLRYPVEWLLELLSSGMSDTQILADYPDLEREDLLAACAFGARLSRVQRIEPVVG
jgi:uncharacterized protein (DUF433 family)